tara:strand:- start:19 stop:582 length:564 start_codon:yes stop_codon:yes gene_type:complete
LKLILLWSLVLLFIITPVYAQVPLSDATGLINRLDVQTSGHVFEIKLVSNFDLNDYSFDQYEKQLTLYLDSGLENNLGEVIIPVNLLSGNFTFYLNDQEFFPKIQSNEKISFITLNFTGSGTNVITISSTEYLSGLIEIIPVENVVPISNEILVNETSGNYLIWLLVACILLIIIVFSIFKILKNKN